MGRDDEWEVVGGRWQVEVAGGRWQVGVCRGTRDVPLRRCTESNESNAVEVRWVQ